MLAALTDAAVQMISTRMSYIAWAPTAIPNPRATNNPAKNSPAAKRNEKVYQSKA